jgi:hypothetical protein
MTAARDPRVDPRPGDVVRLVGKQTRHVHRTTRRGVWWIMPLMYDGGPLRFSEPILSMRSTWVRHCADAEIVRTADE